MRSRFLPFLTALLVAGPAAVALAGAQGLVFVSNEKSDTITVLDPARDHETVATIDACGRPRDMEWDPSRRFLYVACADNNEIGIIDADKLQQVDAIPYIEEPEAFEFDHAFKRLFVSNEEDAALSVVDLESREVIAWVETGEEPEGVYVTPDDRRIWVTSEASNLVHVIDGETYEVLADIPVDTRPRRFAATPDGKEIWVSCELAGKVDIIDAETFEVIDSISFLPRGFRPEQVTPVDVLITRDGKRAYVALGRANHIAVVDVPSRKVEKYVLAGNRVWGLTLTKDETVLYAANGLSDDVSIIDTRSLANIKSVPVGQIPYKVLIRE